MRELRGADTAAKIKEEVLGILEDLGGIAPVAAIVRVGEKPDDIAYEKSAGKRITAYGMKVRSFVFPQEISEAEFLEEFGKINGDGEIDGILLLKPLPKQIDEKKAEAVIDPGKDLDGISPVNVAKVFAGEEDGFAPCTAEAVMEILRAEKIPMKGRNAVVVGRSMVVGRPLAMLLLKENATVTICHTKTADLTGTCRKAEILVAAAGKAGMITPEHVGHGAAVIDVGINVDENGALCGDVQWQGLEEKAEAATPVPGGVGAVTTAVLAKHLALAAAARRYRA